MEREAAIEAARWKGEGVDPNSLEARAVPHPHVCWGWGGQLAVYSPEGGSGISVVALAPILAEADDPTAAQLSAAPGPLAAPAGGHPDAEVKRALEYISAQLRIATEDALNPAAQARALLWGYLEQSIKHSPFNAETTGHEGEAATAIARNFAAMLKEQQASDPFHTDTASSAEPVLRQEGDGGGLAARQAAEEAEALLGGGKHREACEVAMAAGLWDLALMLAYSQPDCQSLWPSLSQRYIRERWRPDSALATTLTVLAGHPEALWEGEGQGEGAAGLSGWRRRLALLLESVDGAQRSAAITALGSKLQADGQCLAAHLCYLLTGATQLEELEAPGAKFALVGYDQPYAAGQRLRLCTEPLSTAIQLTELYEFSLALSSEGGGCRMPPLQRYKLLLALMHAELGVGGLERAGRYCDDLEGSVAAMGEAAFGSVAGGRFLGWLRDLRARLSGACELDHGERLPALLGRSSFAC